MIRNHWSRDNILGLCRWYNANRQHLPLDYV